MQRNIFKYILANSAKQQFIVLCMTIAAIPFYYISLDLPKRIINQAIDASPGSFPRALELGGRTFATLSQLEFLVLLSCAFLLFVLINGCFKYAINVYKGLLGERMLRRLRYQLYALILRFPLSQFRKVSQGEMVSIVASEVEPLGGFIGDSYALPLYQGGLLLTALGFIFIQDPIMGLAVIALYPLQAAIIPRLQLQVNQLGKQRVREVRKLSNQITEAMSLAREIRANDTTRYELAAFTGALARIFDIRYQIYRKKFFIKFLNNFLAQVTPFFFFLIGGYLVIQGELTIGALVAVLAAYKDLAPPWKELLDYYQSQQDARIRYEQIIAQFDIPDLEPLDAPDEADLENDVSIGSIVADKVTFAEDGVTLLAEASFTIRPGEHLALVGDIDSGKDVLANILAGLVKPTTGQVRFGNRWLETLPASIVGRAVAFVDGHSAFLTGTLLDNLTYGLKHDPAPLGPDEPAQTEQRRRERREAMATANSLDDPKADWIDYAAAKLDTPEQLQSGILAALDITDFKETLYELGFRTRFDAEARPETAARILELRRALAEQLTEKPLADLVEAFDIGLYNPRISIAENLLFGEPMGDALDLRRMADNRYVRSILKRVSLDQTLVSLGHDIALAAVKLIGDDVPVSTLQDELLPVTEEEFPKLKMVVGLAARGGPGKLPKGDRRLLISLALRMNASRHRHLAVAPELQSQVLAARRAFRTRLPPNLAAAVAFFDPDRYNSVLTIRDNIIFGKVAGDSPETARRLNQAISSAVDARAMRSLIEEMGLAFHVGTTGANLTPAQRQKLAIARAIVKRPKLLVMCNATTDLDAPSIEKIISRLRESLRGTTIICATADNRLARTFERTIRLQSGLIVDDALTLVAVGGADTGERA